MQIKDQLKQYVDRGVDLAHSNLLDFFLDTYEGDLLPPSESGRGRKPNKRVPYLEGTKHGSKCRVVRSVGHETMPNFVGEWFPRRGVPELQQFYHASMLALLKPWRDIGDIKAGHETFMEAFDHFVAGADERTKQMIENIQYYHECVDSALDKRQRDENKTNDLTSMENLEDEVDEDTGRELNHILDVSRLTQEDIDFKIASEFSRDDKLFAEVALNIAVDHGIFVDEPVTTVRKSVANVATREQMVGFTVLEKLVQSVKKNCPSIDNSKEILPAATLVADATDAQPGVEIISSGVRPIADVALMNARSASST